MTAMSTPRQKPTATPNDPQASQALDVKSVARITGYSVHGVYRLIRSGALRADQPVANGRFTISVAELHRVFPGLFQ